MIAVQQITAANALAAPVLADGKLTETDKPWWQGRGYLFYALFYLIPLFFMGPALAVAALPQWLAIMLALVVFLWVYLRLEDQLQPVPVAGGQLGYQLTGKQVAHWCLLVLIAALVTPLNSGSMTFFGFAGLLLGLCLTGRRLWLSVAMLLGLQALVFWLSFIVIDKLTPYDLWRELVEKQNVALGIVVGAMSLGISIIVAAAIHG